MVCFNRREDGYMTSGVISGMCGQAYIGKTGKSLYPGQGSDRRT